MEENRSASALMRPKTLNYYLVERFTVGESIPLASAPVSADLNGIFPPPLQCGRTSRGHTKDGDYGMPAGGGHRNFCQGFFVFLISLTPIVVVFKQRVTGQNAQGGTECGVLASTSRERSIPMRSDINTYRA